MEHLIKGKKLQDCTTKELFKEWEGGMYLDQAEGLSKEQNERFKAVEKEFFSRDNSDETYEEEKCPH